MGKTRGLWCPGCEQVKIVQEQDAGGRWLPLVCSRCLVPPLTPGAPGRTLEPSDNSEARMRPMSAQQQAWVVFHALEEVRCGGMREDAGGARRACLAYLGSVNPGSIVRLRMRDPRAHLSLDPGGMVQICHNCGGRYELQTARATAAA